ncbi:MAG: LysM peptidoglycan-binding domain-containing protein [Kiloniellales bacterium]
MPPSFDVVRVERSGEAVLAGRAAPNSRVSILVDGRVLGEVRADARGQWVFIPEQKLAPGSHELRLESTGADGRVVHGENIVVVSVPQPRIAAAAPAPRPPPIKQPPADRSRMDPPASDQPASEQAAPIQVAPIQVAPNQQASSQPVSKQPSTDQPAPIQEVAGAAAGPATSAVPETRPPQEAERPLVVLMPSSGQGPSRILQDAESPGEGLGQETLVLETVDYDADGNAVIGGRADPGARLIAYLDAEASGDAVASAQGRWLVNLEKAIAVGLHQLRVDQVDGTGKVVARIETPFSRVAAVSVLAGEATVIVQPGNSLWRIARRVYGRGVRFSVIYRANKDQIRDPDLIYPGQIFVVPGRG